MRILGARYLSLSIYLSVSVTPPWRHRLSWVGTRLRGNSSHRLAAGSRTATISSNSTTTKTKRNRRERQSGFGAASRWLLFVALARCITMAAAAAAPPNEALALLAALTAKLHSPTYRPSVSDSKRRASVALLLRVRAPPGSSSSTNADERGNSTLPTIGAGSARLLDLPRCFESTPLTPW